MTDDEIMLLWHQECKIERGTLDLIKAFARLVSARQREIDAEICIDLMARTGYSDFHFDAGDQCASAIRSQGK
jgi:hypothetical protein